MPAGPQKAAVLRRSRRSRAAVDVQRLIHMANQIARNFAAQGEAAAVEATAQHIRDYWDPRMKAAIQADDGTGLDPIARYAVARLARAAQ